MKFAFLTYTKILNVIALTAIAMLFLVPDVLAGNITIISTDASTANVLPGSLKKEIVLLSVNNPNGGSQATETITGLSFTTANTNNADVTRAQLWYSGTTNSFASATTQLGANVTIIGATISFSFSSSLPKGSTYYFWLTYDISGSATPCSNSVDAINLTSSDITTTATIAFTNSSTTARLIEGAGCRTYCTAGNATAISSYISNVDFYTISRASAWDGYINTGMQTSVQRSLSYNLSITTSNATNSAKNIAAWIDWNNNGIFDATEQVVSTTSITTAAPPQTLTNTFAITIPAGAVLGNTRMRVAMIIAAAADPCDVTNLSDFEDYTIDINAAPTAMVYVSSTATQNNSSSTNAGSVRQQIIGVEIVTSGSLSPLSATSFTFNTAGTTSAVNDISSAQLWSTGSGNAFATSLQIGATVANPNGSFSFLTSVVLQQGTNYFWLTYDVPVSAPGGDSLDAQFTSVTVGSPQTPSTVSPAGKRPIVAATSMVYVSSTVKQNISPVAKGDVKQQIIGIEIVTNGALSPIRATAFTFGDNSTVTSDMLNARLYYTGTNPTFSTTTQVGGTLPPSASFTFASAVFLSYGTNYFWLAYDISPTATCSPNVADARLITLYINSVAASPSPSVTNPFGNRSINCGIPYYSQGSLPVNNLGSWNSQRNGSGAAPASFAAGNDFYVQSGHSMTTASAVTIPNFYVEGGGYVTASLLISMTNFRIYSYGTFEQTAAATTGTYITNFWIDDNGTWIHNNTGNLPGVNRYFSSNSNEVIKQVGGGTFPAATAWGNLIMDISTPGNFVINAGSIITINGNWEWRKTGTSSYWSIASDNSPVNVAKNLIISGGMLRGASDLSVVGNQTAAIVLNVNGDVMISGGTFEDFVRGKSDSKSTLNIGGNVTISGGTWNYTKASGGLSQINLVVVSTSSVWTQTGGVVTLSNTNIKTGKTISLAGTKMGDIASGKTITVEKGSSLMCSNYPVTGVGIFTMQDSSTLGIGNIAGIVSAGLTGNVRTGARNYHSGGNYIYYEGLTPQATGSFITAPVALTVRNLTVNKNLASDIVLMSQPCSVSTKLFLTKGELNLNSNKLTLLNNLTTAITGGAAGVSYIKSETNSSANPSIVQWNAGAINGLYNFPFGVNSNAVNGFIPLYISKSSGTANISVSTRATNTSDNTPWATGVTTMFSATIAGPGQVPVTIDRWWDISPSGAMNAAITFNYRGSENTTTYAPTGTFSAQNWDGTKWLPPVGAGTGVTSGIGAVTIPSQALTFTPWVLSNLAAPLPIELLSFNAIADGNKVNVFWVTATEINNDYFTVEKSVDGDYFYSVATIDGAGNSTGEHSYSTVDNYPLKGISYYRLKQTDFNGRFSYSQLVSVNFSGITKLEIIASYLKDNQFLNLIFQNNKTEKITLVINDMLGRNVYQTIIDAEKGSNSQEIYLPAITSGMYFICLSNSHEKISAKFVKE